MEQLDLMTPAERRRRSRALHIAVDPGTPGALSALDEAGNLLFSAHWFERKATIKGDRLVLRWTWEGENRGNELEADVGAGMWWIGVRLAKMLSNLVEGRVVTLTCEELFVPPGGGAGAPILKTEWGAAMICGPIEHGLGVLAERVKATSWRPVVFGKGAGRLRSDAAKAKALRLGPMVVGGLEGALDRLKRKAPHPLHHVAESACIARWRLVVERERRAGAGRR